MVDPSSPIEPIETLTPAVLRASSHRLCPECFGRLFGRWGHGWTNPERFERIAELVPPPIAVAPSECELCRGALDRWEIWVDRALRASAGVEWHRFTCGSRWDPELLAREEALWIETGTQWGESIRSAFNREWGKQIERRTGASGGPTDPEIVFLADVSAGVVETTRMPLYLKGRYLKFDRSLPQTRWPCRRCQGRGCVDCQGSGKTYPTSVEELLGAPAIAQSGAEATKFHGMGREDIDARMLGSGRPFVLELVRPARRSLDLAALLEEIERSVGDRVRLVNLAWADAAEVIRVKEAAPEKSYRVGVRTTAAQAKVKEALALVEGQQIAQRTPTRVAHRRSDRVRPRRIVHARLVSESGGIYTIDLRTESGTYVKEWVEGDGGRTQPNLSQLLDAPCTVEFLDVLEIHDQEQLKEG